MTYRTEDSSYLFDLYPDGHEALVLLRCPVCDEQLNTYDGKHDHTGAADHIAEHSPADFGLTPLGDSDTEDTEIEDTDDTEDSIEIDRADREAEHVIDTAAPARYRYRCPEGHTDWEGSANVIICAQCNQSYESVIDTKENRALRVAEVTFIDTDLPTTRAHSPGESPPPSA